MTKKELWEIKTVIHKADQWIRNCHCGYKDGKCTWCEQYGCESIDDLVKPLRQLIENSKLKNIDFNEMRKGKK